MKSYDLAKAHRQGYRQGKSAEEALRKAMADRIEELEAKALANKVAIMRLEAALAKAVEATETMLDRYLLYCGGKDMPFAVHTDQKIVESVRAALAELMEETDDD